MNHRHSTSRSSKKTQRIADSQGLPQSAFFPERLHRQVGGVDRTQPSPRAPRHASAEAETAIQNKSVLLSMRNRIIAATTAIAELYSARGRHADFHACAYAVAMLVATTQAIKLNSKTRGLMRSS